MNRYIIVVMMVATFAGCSEILYETDISNEEVCIFAPTDMAELSNTNVSFSWCEIEGATGYRLQIAKPSFTNATEIVLDTIISNTEFSKTLLPDSYQWRVKAQNAVYETSYTTSAFTLVDNTDFTQINVHLEAPIDNFITNQVTQNLTWTAVNGATDYRIQVWQPDTNGILVTDEISNSNQKDITFNEGSFVWRVRAQNATANTQYSQRTILVDTTVPNTPTLQTPADATTVPAGSITFTWERVLIDGSEELDSLYIYNDAALTNLFSKEEVMNNTYSIDLAANTYYWRMKSFDRAGNESDFSSTFSLILN